MASYEMFLISDLHRQSSRQGDSDFIMARDFIFGRLNALKDGAPNSQFNKTVDWLRKLVPNFILIRLLFLLGYDSMIFFRSGDNGREILGMISFQKHPQKSIIGMFDIYIVDHLRKKDVAGNFRHLSEMIYQTSQRFKQSYHYMQCGNNLITQRILRIYGKLYKKKGWQGGVDVYTSRIYLGNTLPSSLEL